MKIELKILCWHNEIEENVECELHGSQMDPYYVCPKCKREIRLVIKPEIFLQFEAEETKEELR